MLANEFLIYIKKISSRLFMSPHPSHPILVEYDRLFDQVVRFNKVFFDQSEEAAGFPRLETNITIDESSVRGEFFSPLVVVGESTKEREKDSVDRVDENSYGG